MLYISRKPVEGQNALYSWLVKSPNKGEIGKDSEKQRVEKEIKKETKEEKLKKSTNPMLAWLHKGKRKAVETTDAGTKVKKHK